MMYKGDGLSREYVNGKLTPDKKFWRGMRYGLLFSSIIILVLWCLI